MGRKRHDRIRGNRAGSTVSAAIFVGAVLGMAMPARADVLCVNTDGSGGCSTSVAAAVSAAGIFDEVQVAPGTYVEPQMPVTNNRKRVRGAGVGVTILQITAGTAFDVQGQGARLDLSDLTIEGPVGGSGIRYGYAGQLELARVEIKGAREGIGISGGQFSTRVRITDSSIHSHAEVGIEASDRFRLLRSTVHSNGSHGMRTFGIQVVTIEDCTFSGNVGPAIFGHGGSVILRNSTIVGDSTVEGGAIDVGPVQRVTLDGSIVTDDAGGVPGLADVRATSGKVRSRGFNLVKDGFAGNPPLGKTALDVVGVDPLLEPLADHGGPGLTHALAPGSPALEAVLLKRGCRRPDQRGVVREPAPCDIGAFEAP
jgi:hypothetical protein